MKSKLLLIAIMAITSLPLCAQEISDEPFTPIPITEIPTEEVESTQQTFDPSLSLIKRDAPYRVTVGPILYLSSLYPSYNDHINLEAKDGYGFGAIVNMRFGRRTESARGGTGKFAIETGFIYQIAPFKSRIYYLKENHYEKIKLNGYQIPVILQYYPWKGSFIEGGAVFSGVLSASPKYLSINENERLNLSAMQGYDIKVNIGGGYEIGPVLFGLKILISTKPLAPNFDTKIGEMEYFVRYNFRIINR